MRAHNACVFLERTHAQDGLFCKKRRCPMIIRFSSGEYSGNRCASHTVTMGRGCIVCTNTATNHIVSRDDHSNTILLYHAIIHALVRTAHPSVVDAGS